MSGVPWSAARSNVWTSMHARWRLWKQFEHWRGRPGRCAECGGRLGNDDGTGVTIHLPGCTQDADALDAGRGA